MKVVAFEVEKWECEAFDRLSREDGHEVQTHEHPLRAENVERFKDAQAISTFMESKLNADVLKQMESLKLIATRSTGFDHIATDYCRENGVVVSNVPTYGSNTVAEHTFGLLLAVSKRIVEASNRTQKGDFSFRGLQGFDLEHKTIGIIGTGDIGLHACRIARGFNMNVIAFDVQRNEEAAREIGFEYVDSLEALLGQSDVVSIHVPANPKTEGMLGQEQFEQMKDGAVLINTARGPIVEIRALVRALAEGKLAGAGLDVLPEEPVIREEAELLRRVYEQRHDLHELLADHVITHLRNVVVTPHSAFNTREAVQRIIDTTVENIQRFADGDPINIVAETGKASD